MLTADEGRLADDLVGEAASLTRDLAAPNPAIYWSDLVLSAALGYGALALAIIASPVALKLTAGVIAILALYRALSFIHELTHLKPGALPYFRTAWNGLVGVPLMVPSFMYEGVHNLHHARTRYGTAEDPEYLPLARLNPAAIAAFLIAPLFAPLAAVIRFGVLAPLSLLIPPLRKIVVERASALTIAPSFRRKPPESADWRSWEAAASLWALMLIITTVAGLLPLNAILTFCAVYAGVTELNQWRTLVAHLWENDGAPISISRQYLDSVNVPKGVLPALWAPVGLRYHALHHLLPALPYHALGAAHRRLIRSLPDRSPLHRADHDGMITLVLRLMRSSAAR